MKEASDHDTIVIMIMYILSFAALLGPLIFIHELGHYLFAKLFNVRVDAFSMGFGPKIFKKKKGETEYCLSIIPLGGYVKLLGQDPSEQVSPELLHRTLNTQAAWKRFLIFIGGPLFNFLFAIFIFGVMMVMGEPHVVSVLERVPTKTDAYIAGFRTGDVVTAIDNENINKIETVQKIVSDSDGKPLHFKVKRANQTVDVTATPKSAPGYSIYGETITVGAIDGLLSPARHPIVGISNPASIAAKTGLKTGDEIVSVNGIRIKSFEEVEAAFQQVEKTNAPVHLSVAQHELGYWQSDRKIETSAKPTLEVELPAQSLDQIGLYSSELFVASLVKESAAEKNGLQVGDRLVSVDGVNLQTFADLKDAVQKSGEEKGKLTITVERFGKKVTKEIVPTSSEVKDPVGQMTKQYMIGVYPLFYQAEPQMIIERVLNPITIVSEAWSRSIDLSAKTFISLKKLVTREVSMGTLGGPLLIGKLAGDSMERGLAYFLRVMALISISLAVFNVLPVPILDGGHIVLLGIEVVRGRPFSLRQSELVQQVGLTLILFLLVVVMFNDISRVGMPAIRRMLE